jgi:hypothetical protein
VAVRNALALLLKPLAARPGAAGELLVREVLPNLHSGLTKARPFDGECWAGDRFGPATRVGTTSGNLDNIPQLLSP